MLGTVITADFERHLVFLNVDNHHGVITNADHVSNCQIEFQLHSAAPEATAHLDPRYWQELYQRAEVGSNWTFLVIQAESNPNLSQRTDGFSRCGFKLFDLLCHHIPNRPQSQAIIDFSTFTVGDIEDVNNLVEVR